jgi:hypothetical protein
MIMQQFFAKFNQKPIRVQTAHDGRGMLKGAKLHENSFTRKLKENKAAFKNH